jgi:sporulation protein YlmC with PRC-barrel domain
MDVYSDAGQYLGEVQDVIVDLEKGEILRITLEPLLSVTREDAKRVLREKSILYTVRDGKAVRREVKVGLGG